MKAGVRATAWLGSAVVLFALFVALAPAGQAGRAELRQEIKVLQAQAEALQVQAAGLEQGIAKAQESTRTLAVNLESARKAAGLLALQGPGVTVRMTDADREKISQAGEYGDINWFLVHDRDVLRVVNALNTAGAEALSINGVRLLADTAIHCGGPAIYVRDIPLTPPFLIEAIGDPQLLRAALVGEGAKQPSDVYRELTAFGVVIDVNVQSLVRIPAAESTDAAIRAAHQ